MHDEREHDRDRPAVRASGLVKHYGNVRALDELSIQIPAGTIHGLLGPNGAGKSTAINVLSTLVDITQGTAEVAGFDVSRQADRVRQRIGLVGQTAALDEILGGRQNLLIFGQLLGLSRRDAKRRADELLGKFSLTEAADRAVSTYSGGMRRRLDIAVGMILDPVVLFLDEPTTGLDPRGRTDVWNSVREIAARGTTVLLTTQYLEEADSLASQVSIMKAGRIIAEGTPNDLKRQRGGDRVEITAADQAEAIAMRDALNTADTSASEEAAVELDEATAVVTCPATRGTGDLATVVRKLDAAGITTDDIVLRRPTLDEVFLTLTEKEDA
ncbi:ATP-binding cassette domain-containing protein [Brevibacterium sp. UCMA 11754]|uniref:ATP-binding cassette domain-containing protein n=1 Tax=Brevibacterium sp. UCMA 11754 TaxID=2749198 RepID=UPI001F3A3FEB|nr:ATP-binding cassette domain-containing protein [Brevibacterium sp. UCMA 11754]MCF2573789.1 ATP-binding cassette domain-containing protein [Brevibacterium sp. UCMA 11754]